MAQRMQMEILVDEEIVRDAFCGRPPGREEGYGVRTDEGSAEEERFVQENAD